MEGYEKSPQVAGTTGEDNESKFCKCNVKKIARELHHMQKSTRRYLGSVHQQPSESK